MLNNRELQILDFQHFADSVYSECAAVFPHILSELSHENIYFIGLLYNGDQWSRLQPAIETVEGTIELVQEYEQQEFYRDHARDALIADTKWSPLESKRTFQYSGSLPKSVQRLNDSLPLRFGFSDEEFESKNEDFNSRMIKACVSALKRLEIDGVFKSLERSGFVLNLVEIGQSIEDRLALAQQLNPSDVYKWYESELLI